MNKSTPLSKTLLYSVKILSTTDNMLVRNANEHFPTHFPIQAVTSSFSDKFTMLINQRFEEIFQAYFMSML